jgi:RasGEF domain/RasGEF N-terminal motif
LLTTVLVRLDPAKLAPTRRRANSSAHASGPASPRPPSGQSKHSRASSELSGSLLRSFPRSTVDTESHDEGANIRGYARSSTVRGGLAHLPLHPATSASGSAVEISENDEITELGSPTTGGPQSYAPDLTVVSDVPFKSTKSTSMRGPSQPSKNESSKKIVDSFLDMDEENEEDYDSDDIPILDREDERSDKPVKSIGQTWDELVDRLLAQPTSKSDSNFTAIFLCLYRMFGAPGELLQSIEKRFDRANNDDNHYMIRISSQLRYLSVMSQWLSEYPGDFSFPETRQKLSRFIGSLSRHRVFAAVIKDMQASLDVAVEDDDFIWGRSDFDREGANVTDGLSNASAFQSSSSTLNVSSSTEEVPEDLGETGLAEDNPGDLKRASESASISSSGGDSLGAAAGRAEQEALSLIPARRIPFTKLIFNQFISTPDGDIAQELTRIDWIMFSSIRARDLVRHVSLSASQKEKCMSLGNVNRMIAHFNHVAYWVANMILMRDKAKHRARALEKFMRIAWVWLCEFVDEQTD